MIDGKQVSGGFFDFGLYLFHNAKELLASGSGPYFYLPKLESHLEARLWNDVFLLAQQRTGYSQWNHQSNRAYRDDPGDFEMDEILLNCGSIRRLELWTLGLYL